MAVGHDASSESHTGADGTVGSSFSWTHGGGTPSGVLVICYGNGGAGDPASAVTYGGVSMTKVPSTYASDSATEFGACVAFFLGSSIPTGNQTVEVTTGNVPGVEYTAHCATVTASADTETNGPVLLQGDGTFTEQNVNDGSPGTNSLRYAGCWSGRTTPPPQGANSTALQSIDLGNQSCSFVRETNAGQGSRPVGFSDGTSDDRAAVHIAIREVAARKSLPPGLVRRPQRYYPRRIPV